MQIYIALGIALSEPFFPALVELVFRFVDRRVLASESEESGEAKFKIENSFSFETAGALRRNIKVA